MPLLAQVSAIRDALGAALSLLQQAQAELSGAGYENETAQINPIRIDFPHDREREYMHGLEVVQYKQLRALPEDAATGISDYPQLCKDIQDNIKVSIDMTHIMLPNDHPLIIGVRDKLVERPAETTPPLRKVGGRGGKRKRREEDKDEESSADDGSESEGSPECEEGQAVDEGLLEEKWVPRHRKAWSGLGVDDWVMPACNPAIATYRGNPWFWSLKPRMQDRILHEDEKNPLKNTTALADEEGHTMPEIFMNLYRWHVCQFPSLNCVK